MYELDLTLYLTFLVINLVLIGVVCWGLIILDDLSHDFKNPIDAARTLNKLFVIEYTLHSVLFLLSLFMFRWVILLVNVPLVLYLLYNYVKRVPRSTRELYDSTTILNHKTLKQLNIDHWVKIVFHLVMFLAYAIGSLIFFILYLSSEDEK